LTVIAYFISPHGYGHAARGSAVMAALHNLKPALRFEIFTQVPEWFFQESLPGSFGYHSLLTDIGLVQKSSLVEDLPATVQRLQEFLPFDPANIDQLAGQVTQLNCHLILCDIAPLGIAVAHAAGIPAFLIENFTWDWIYEGYLPEEKRLAGPITYLQQLFTRADSHIQTEPVCRPSPRAALTAPPICRPIRTQAALVRNRLGLPGRAKIVLITMGGMPWRYTFLEQLERMKGVYFVIPGGGPRLERRGNVVLFPRNSDFYHPDLINAADAVIGKVGYSTLAEVFQAGVPFGYVARSRFRESPALVAYIRQQMQGLEIAASEFEDGSWLARLPELLAMPRFNRNGANGATRVAHFVLERVL
jgi:hypothetical protein